jgi:hypothetical protein
VRLSNVLRGAAGFLAGLAFWWAFSVPYNGLLCRSSEWLIRLFERPRATRLHAQAVTMVVDRTDFRRGSPRPIIHTPYLTVNVILLTALFAANPKTFSTANVSRFLIALPLLTAVHIIAVAVKVQSIYARSFGDWSERRYGQLALDLWTSAASFYQVAGGAAAAFVLWWLLAYGAETIRLKAASSRSAARS